MTKKYQYQFSTAWDVSSYDLINQLNNLGNDGWEVVHIERKGMDYDIICKREAPKQGYPSNPSPM